MAIILALAACAPTPDASDGEIVVDRAPCGFLESVAGQIDVSERVDGFHAEVYGVIEAKLQDGPDLLFHEVAETSGACEYLARSYGSCDPACGTGEFCTADSACLAYPSEVSGGTLSIHGLDHAIEITAEDYAPGTYTGPAGLPGALFAADQPIGAELSGGKAGPLTLGVVGVAALDETLVRSGLHLEDGVDAVVEWTPGTDPDACVSLVLNGSNATHGAPLDDIVRCEGPDTGTLTVPADIIARYPYGETPEVTEGYDWPHSTLTRYVRSRAGNAYGDVELLARSTVAFLVDHPEP